MRILSFNESDLIKELEKVGVVKESIPIFLKKARRIILKLEDLSCAKLNVLKQVALTCDSDCAIHKDIISGKKKKGNAILFTSERGLEKIVNKLSYQGDFLKDLCEKLRNFLLNYKKDKFILKFRNKTYDLNKEILVMGILNLTPDSFYDGGRFKDKNEAVDFAIKMEEEGADIIDIGGESTRPGSSPVSVKEELKRVLPVLKEVVKKVKVPISIDTYKSEVARICLDEGAEIVNDISALRFDKKMVEVCAEYDCYTILMHIKGRPKTMQKRVDYKDVIKEIYDYFCERVLFATKKGIKREKLIIDPGIGFGKLLEHNLEIIRRLSEFKTLDLPILVGHSRKSFIGKILNCEAKERLIGSIACAALLCKEGANILRVHDVKETKEAIKIFQAVYVANL